MQEVVMYYSQFCPYCHGAEQLFSRLGVAVRLISVDEDADVRRLMAAKTGRDTVPQIFLGEHHVGGYDDLTDLHESGELDALLSDFR